MPEWAQHLARRLSRDGLLDQPEDLLALRTALGALNQRLRYVLGEYDQEPVASDGQPDAAH